MESIRHDTSTSAVATLPPIAMITSEQGIEVLREFLSQAKLMTAIDMRESEIEVESLVRNLDSGLDFSLNMPTSDSGVDITILGLRQAIPIFSTQTLRRSPLVHAIKIGNSRLVELLLNWGADPNFIPPNDVSPILAVFVSIIRKESDRTRSSM